jgi:hypothetical protein
MRAHAAAVAVEERERTEPDDVDDAEDSGA